MRVYVTHDPIELDELPAGTAGSIAEQLRGGALVGRTFTLKADGVELDPDAQVPTGAKVLEVVECVPAFHAGGIVPPPEPVLMHAGETVISTEE